MKKILCFIFILNFIFCNVCLAKKTPEEARLALGQINIPYTEQAFIKVIIENKDTFAVSYFIDAGMNPNCILNNNFTPLNIAALYHNIEATKLLLEAPNIDITWKNKNDMTSLDIAAACGFDDIVNLYAQKGYYPNIELNAGLSETEIKKALDLGKTTSSSKKNIIALEKKSFKLQPRGFLGKVELQGKAYWLSPYCVLATNSIISQKKYTDLTETAVKMSAASYQTNIIFDLNTYHLSDLAELKIIAKQDDILIYPHFVNFHIPSAFNVFGWNKRGVSANFFAAKINPNKPVSIIITSAATSRELIINFDNSLNGKYIIENSDYLWKQTL